MGSCDARHLLRGRGWSVEGKEEGKQESSLKLNTLRGKNIKKRFEPFIFKYLKNI